MEIPEEECFEDNFGVGEFFNDERSPDKCFELLQLNAVSEDPNTLMANYSQPKHQLNKK